MLTDEEVKSLKKLLPRGYFKKIQERTQLSEKSVSDFFSFKNKRYNQKIHKASLDIIEESRLEDLKIKQRHKKLIENDKNPAGS